MRRVQQPERISEAEEHLRNCVPGYTNDDHRPPADAVRPSPPEGSEEQLKIG